MESSNLLDVTKTTLKSVGRLNLFPFSSPYFLKNTANPILVTNSVFLKRTHWKIPILFLISVVVSGLYKVIGEQGNLLHTFCSSFHIFGFTVTALSVYCHHKRSKEFVSLFNQILQRAGCDGNNAKTNTFWLAQGTLFISNNYTSLAFLFGIFCGVRPTSDWRVLPEFVLTFMSSHIPVLGVQLFSFWYTCTVWRIYGNFGTINCNLVALIPTFAFVQALKSLRRKRIAAQNQHEFYSNVLQFREINILLNIYNDIASFYIMPAYILIGTTGFFFSLYAVVARLDELDVGTIAIFSSALAVSGAEVVGCFHWAKKINSDSKLMRKNAFPVNGTVVDWSLYKRKMGKRYFKSFPELRVYFGNNFFERVTPLVMLDFSINQALSLILMGK